MDYCSLQTTVLKTLKLRGLCRHATDCGNVFLYTIDRGEKEYL